MTEFNWPEQIIDALGKYHDEEECDGPEDLINEIRIVVEAVKVLQKFYDEN